MSKPRFLIVDDEEGIRFLIRTLLEMEGVDKTRIDEAVDGQEAWEKFTSKEGLPYQVLITDTIMPRMNGLQLIEKVLAKFVGVKIVCMSGFNQTIDERADFLQKPFQNDRLWALVKKYA